MGAATTGTASEGSTAPMLGGWHADQPAQPGHNALKRATPVVTLVSQSGAARSWSRAIGENHT